MDVAIERLWVFAAECPDRWSILKKIHFMRPHESSTTPRATNRVLIGTPIRSRN
ncbi:hypothetical protein RSSM_00687 [Rhodopirellula sallentina SM41]|uniref:Uncharacterized protein n=1 Tax=Rhodopirellula sallentina SM41 TaxID=1263870 RepID=M5UPD9_9BACT|nr:hypothetical protein RSSM_00687 [Rhodopirellula sallentina SM41]